VFTPRIATQIKSRLLQKFEERRKQAAVYSEPSASLTSSHRNTGVEEEKEEETVEVALPQLMKLKNAKKLNLPLHDFNSSVKSIRLDSPLDDVSYETEIQDI